MLIREIFLACFIKIVDTILFFNDDGNDPTKKEGSITQVRCLKPM